MSADIITMDVIKEAIYPRLAPANKVKFDVWMAQQRKAGEAPKLPPPDFNRIPIN